MFTNNFDFENIASSAGWIKELERTDNEHEHEHEHEHHHDEGEAEEYGISTFVYVSRKPFNEERFNNFVNEKLPSNVIRAKGLVWFSNDNDMSYLFEQSGKQVQLSEAGYWIASAPKDELKKMIAQNPEIMDSWDEKVGDRMVKLVFIGRKMDKDKIIRDLDDCT